MKSKKHQLKLRLKAKKYRFRFNDEDQSVEYILLKKKTDWQANTKDLKAYLKTGITSKSINSIATV